MILNGWCKDYFGEGHDLGSYTDKDEGDFRGHLNQTPHFTEEQEWFPV